MFHHLFHELRQLRFRVVSDEYDEEKRERYLRALFDFSINVPAKYYDEEFVSRMAENYLKHVKNDHPARELEVKAKILFARLNLLSQQAPDAPAIRRIDQEIRTAELYYKKVSDPHAKGHIVSRPSEFSPDGKTGLSHAQKIFAQDRVALWWI